MIRVGGPWNEEKRKRQSGSAKMLVNRPITVKHRRFKLLGTLIILEKDDGCIYDNRYLLRTLLLLGTMQRFK